MHRATRQRTADTRLTVLDCADLTQLEGISAHTFFKG